MSRDILDIVRLNHRKPNQRRLRFNNSPLVMTDLEKAHAKTGHVQSYLVGSVKKTVQLDEPGNRILLLATLVTRFNLRGFA